MNKQNPEVVEREFFRALIEANSAALERLLTDDCLLIDVMSGSEVTRAQLIDSVTSGRLQFDEINRIDYRVRPYGLLAIVTGQTEMIGSFDGQTFNVPSRYTHVFVDQGYGWRMATAQGTQIIAPPA
jgi:ketosteroid isomerase-like protein